MRQKQINKLLAIRVPKILETLTRPYVKSQNPQNYFVYNEIPAPVLNLKKTTTSPPTNETDGPATQSPKKIAK